MTAATHQRRTLLPEHPTIRPLDGLADLVPAGQRLVMQEETGLLVLLSLDQQGRPALVKQYPAYCPYEIMLAHFSYTRVNNERIDRMRQQLYAARDEGSWDGVMRPVRNLLSRARFKLRPFGIGIVSLLELGYTLLPLRRAERGGDVR